MRLVRPATLGMLTAILAACSGGLPAGASSSAATTGPSAASAAASPSFDLTKPGSQGGLNLDLTFTGPHINEHLKTGFIPEADGTYCNQQISQTIPAFQFPASITVEPQTVGGKGWSTFDFNDPDGPGNQSSGKLDLAVINGADRIYYTWAPDTGTTELSTGSVAYSSDHQTITFDVSRS